MFEMGFFSTCSTWCHTLKDLCSWLQQASDCSSATAAIASSSGSNRSTRQEEVMR